MYFSTCIIATYKNVSDFSYIIILLQSQPAKCLAILSASPEICPATISPLAAMIQTLSAVPYPMDQIPSASMWSLSLLEEIAVLVITESTYVQYINTSSV